jgi:hypothetical protein
MRTKLMMTDRDGDRETERQRDRQNKVQGVVLYLFLLKQTVWKKQDHILQSSILVQTENIMFNFDIVLKSDVGMQ